eukprot:COSAG01_NODE_477_length_16509_cov_38.684217_25_plen_72_part_00
MRSNFLLYILPRLQIKFIISVVLELAHNQHKVVEVLGQRVRDTRVDLVAIEFEFGQTDIGTTRLLADAHLL